MSKKNYILPLLLSAGAVALFATSGSAATKIDNDIKLPSGSRGLRNNNPGNIRKSSTVFTGEVIPSTDPSFKQFKTMGYGYRAMFKILQTYISNGYNTLGKVIPAIGKIISRWAPPTENATKDYINFAAKYTGIDPNTILGYTINPTNIVKIVRAISRVENGVDAVEKDVSDGYQLWLKG